MTHARVLRWLLLDALMILVIVVAGLMSYSAASVRPAMDRGRTDQKQVQQNHNLVPSAGQIFSPIEGEWWARKTFGVR